jgi:hypothetical protein
MLFGKTNLFEKSDRIVVKKIEKCCYRELHREKSKMEPANPNRQAFRNDPMIKKKTNKAIFHTGKPIHTKFK